MSVFAQIHTDLITALKSKDGVRVSTLRSMKAALQKDVIDNKGSSEDDQRAFVILKQEAKKRDDSIQAYRSAGRQDLADQEQTELGIIKSYLPAELSETEIEAIIDQVVQTNAGQNFGLLMKQVMQATGGRADGKRVSMLLKQKLV